MAAQTCFTHTTHTPYTVLTRVLPPLYPVTGPLVPFSPISEESGEEVPSSAALQEGIASLKPSKRPTDSEPRSTSKSPDSKSEDQRELQFESSMEIGSGENERYHVYLEIIFL